MPTCLALQVQSEQHGLAVRQVADDSPQQQGQLFDQGGSSDNLFIFRERWFLVNINHFQVVLAAQMLVTDGIDVYDRAARPGGGAPVT